MDQSQHPKPSLAQFTSLPSEIPSCFVMILLVNRQTSQRSSNAFVSISPMISMISVCLLFILVSTYIQTIII
jgi:hypothetical protein